jgi:hypothetical protein
MNKIGLIITINKYKHYFETNKTQLICETIDEARDILINNLTKEFSNLNIDYPFDLIDFEHHWFNQHDVKMDAFNYDLFIKDKWCKPWELQEIYLDVLDKIQANEEANPPNFDEIYGEPDPDEDIIDKFPIDKNEVIHEFEKKLTDIIEQAKTSNFKTKEEKEYALKI